MNAGFIIENIRMNYPNGCRYKLANAFVFKWESDYFIQKNTGYAYEFEVKISRSDFFADKQKVDKHLVLNMAEHEFRPNRFFYVVPKGLITVNEVPKYAGLMYCDKAGNIKTVKPAPLIHKKVLKFEDKLCLKFYYHWLNAKVENNELTREKERLEKLLADNHIEINPL